MKISSLCKSRHGTYSTKRVAGLSLVTMGMFEKFTLFFFTLLHQLEAFDQLDASANWLITFGIGSLTTTLFEKNINNIQNESTSK